MPRTMKKSVVIHSGGSCGGMQVRSRPWMVWHCRTRPTSMSLCRHGNPLMGTGGRRLPSDTKGDEQL
ncbi:hypothetical protein EYF80_038472 [Liparis tanakae]|uniref:Uncharacterized protein n=1 Tax=Liparis tanakae TaxID=230148 RepID=A0A4Z2GCM9_9TELE|nr:hypothetical protein EYF80_038472 [Liparis tanakae]